MKKQRVIFSLLLMVHSIAVLHSMEPQKDIIQVEIENQKNTYGEGWTASAFNKSQKDTLMGSIHYRKTSSKIWQIERLQVFAEFQRKGIGLQLFKAAINHIKSKKPHEIHWVATLLFMPSKSQPSTQILGKMYRKYCQEIQSILPGTLHETPAFGSINMLYKVK